jgi:hypothetical protein
VVNTIGRFLALASDQWVISYVFALFDLGFQQSCVFSSSLSLSFLVAYARFVLFIHAGPADCLIIGCFVRAAHTLVFWH